MWKERQVRRGQEGDEGQPHSCTTLSDTLPHFSLCLTPAQVDQAQLLPGSLSGTSVLLLVPHSSPTSPLISTLITHTCCHSLPTLPISTIPTFSQDAWQALRRCLLDQLHSVSHFHTSAHTCSLRFIPVQVLQAQLLSGPLAGAGGQGSPHSFPTLQASSSSSPCSCCQPRPSRRPVIGTDA